MSYFTSDITADQKSAVSFIDHVIWTNLISIAVILLISTIFKLVHINPLAILTISAYLAFLLSTFRCVIYPMLFNKIKQSDAHVAGTMTRDI
jgi:hypothetical protein